MIRNLAADDERFLNSLGQITTRLVRAQRQVSSGKKILDPSDSPDQVGALLAARANLSRIEQVKQNLGNIKTEVDSAEQAISNSVKILERARTLAAQGVTGTQTAANRAAIAEEVTNLMQQLTNAANTSVNGRYIFSGDTDSTQPFTFTAGPPPAVSAYAGVSSTRLAVHPGGDTFSISKSGDTIFTDADPTQNAFGVLTALQTALTNNDEPGITQTLSDLGSADEYMNRMLAWYGAAQNRVSEAVTTASSMQLQLDAQVGQIEDADMTQAILDMNRAAFEQETALNARARMPQSSLFDYLG